MKAIVTGSSGLLGRSVAAALGAAGHEVLGIDVVAPPASAAARHISADLANRGAALELVRGADVVVHAAAIPRPVGRPAGDVFSTNVEAAFNVVEACVLAGIPRLVLASSFSVLGLPFAPRPVPPLYFPVDERHPATPQDAYALSKWLSEEIVEAAVRRSDLVAASLRLPWIQTRRSFPLEVAPRRSTPDAALDLWAYIDTRDAAEAFRLAVERPLHGHARLFVAAPDTYAEASTAELVAAHYPGVPFTRPLVGNEGLLDTGAARAVLGFRPRHSWRAYSGSDESGTLEGST